MAIKTLVSLLFFISHVHAQDMTVKINSTQSTVLKSETVEVFVQHLNRRLEVFKSKVPDYYHIEMKPDTPLRDLIRSSFFPVGANYKNRDVQCRFIAHLKKQASAEVAIQIDALTRSETICIAGDLPRNEVVKWTQDWIRFFWFEKWFSSGGHYLSLEDIIISKIGAENYKAPMFIIAVNEGFDGYGSGSSASDKQLAQSDATLLKFFELGALFDPNVYTPEAGYKFLGPEIENILVKEGSPYNTTGLVRLQSEIYLSPAWPVAELIELLVHEYAHVLDAEQGPNKTWNPESKTLTCSMNGFQTEALAEAFTELALQDIFTAFPETEAFHILKLKAFSEIRKNDNHFLGAAAVYPLFFQGQQDYKTWLELARASDIELFLKNLGLSPIVSSVKVEKNLKVYFSE